jgi:hypothetical protein
LTPEHDTQLCTEFPVLYRDRHRSMRESCMCWGFSCSNGWFQIIYDLSKKIAGHSTCTCPDWMEGPHQRNEHCPMNGPPPVASQVKEKFGTLRFYVDYADEEINEWIDEAEKLSAVTCEMCGGAGHLQEGSWLRTLCDPCEADRLATRARETAEFMQRQKVKKVSDG